MDKVFNVYYLWGIEESIRQWENALYSPCATMEDIEKLIKIFTSDYVLLENVIEAAIILKTDAIYPQLLQAIKNHLIHGVAIKWMPLGKDNVLR